MVRKLFQLVPVVLAVCFSFVIEIPIHSHGSRLEELLWDFEYDDIHDVHDISFESLLNVKITTASKMKEGVEDAPANVYVITYEEMVERGYRSLIDVFNDIPGVYNPTARMGDYTNQPIIRGHYGNNRLKVMINGMGINPKSGKELELMDRFPIGNVERVEFIIGPYASLYGRNSFSGVLNIITKSGEDLEGGRANFLYGGTYNQFQGELVYGKKGKNYDFMISGFKNKSKQGRDLVEEYPELYSWDARINAIRREIFWVDADNIDPRVPKEYYLPWDHDDLFLNVKLNNGLRLDCHYNQCRYPLNADLTPLYYYQNEDTYSQSTSMNSRLQYVYENDRLTSTTSLFHQYYDNRRMHGYIVNTTKWFRHRAKSFGFEEILRYKLFKNNSILAGISYEQVKTYLDIVGPNIYNAPLPQWEKDDILTSRILNLTLQTDINLTNQLKLVLGIMYEKSNRYSDVLVPRVSFLWNISKHSALKLLYGSGYITPDPLTTVDQVVSQSADGLKGTTDLGPEYLTAYEINFCHAFGKHVHLSASVYHNYIKDIVEAVEDSSLPEPFIATWANLGKRKATGVDLGIKVFFNDNIRGFLKYSYVEGKVEIGDVGDTPVSTLDKLPGTVPHSFKAGISCKLFKGKFNFYVSNHYIHEWETFLGAKSESDQYAIYNEISEYIDGKKIKGYNLVDLTISTTEKLNEKFQFSFQVRNLLDAKGFQSTVNTDYVFYIPEAIHRLNWNFQVSYKF